MRAAVVGGGAMGAAFAAEATTAGLDVAILDVDQALVERISADGILVEDPNGALRVKVEATANPGALGQVDLVILFVKGYHTAAAARSITALLGSRTTVVTLQNGWGNADVLAATLPPERIVMGVTYHSCSVAGPGHVRHTGHGPTVVGSYQADGSRAEATAVAAFLDAAGWPAETSAEVRTEIWKKLVLNAATLPTAALAQLAAGDLTSDEPMRDLVDALAVEAVAVARAQGLDIDAAERIERIHAVLAGAGRGKASMLQDIEARRRTEIATVNGAVVAVGARAGVDTPLNHAMLALVQGLERSWVS